MNKKVLITAAVILVIIIAGYFLLMPKPEQPGQTTANQQSKPKVIKIGAILPLTGPAARVGILVKNALELSLRSNTKIELYFEDSKNNPKDGIAAFRKLVNINKTSIIISALSSVSMPLIPMADNNKIPLFLTLVTYPDIAKKGEWLFRHFINNADEAELMVDFLINKMDIKNISILYSNDEGGLGSKSEFERKYLSLGGNVKYEESFDLKTTDFRSVIAKIVDIKSEAIYIIGYGKTLGIIAKQIRAMKVDLPLFSMAQFGAPDALQAAGKSAEGVYFTAPSFSYNENISTVKKEFLDTYKKEFHFEPNFIAAYAFDLGKIIEKGVMLSQKYDIDFMAAIKRIKNFEGATGYINISDDGEISSELVVVKIKNGHPVEAFSRNK